jgi:Cu2+-exporting ATPase
MKTTVIKLEGLESVLASAGIEKHLCTMPGIHKVETNFVTGAATIYHDESVALTELKRCVAHCGYRCSGEALPEHVSAPGDPPAAHAAHVPPAAPAAAHAGHASHSAAVMPAAGEHAARQAMARV